MAFAAQLLDLAHEWAHTQIPAGILQQQVHARLDGGVPSHDALAYWCAAGAGLPHDLSTCIAAVAYCTRLGVGLLDDLQDDDPDASATTADANVAVALILLGHPASAFTDVPPNTWRRVVASYKSMMLHMGSGQHTELANGRPWSLSEYEAVIANKTGAFTTWASVVGPMLAGVPENPFASLGAAVGQLYQVNNDYRGLQPSARTDICRHWTWPANFAYAVLEPDDQAELLLQWDVGDEDAVRDAVVQAGAVHFLTTLSLRYYTQAMEALAQCPLQAPEAERAIQEIINHLALLPFHAIPENA